MQHQLLSSSVGGYAKATWEVAGLGAASTKALSVPLSVAPASVTNMLGRLREMISKVSGEDPSKLASRSYGSYRQEGGRLISQPASPTTPSGFPHRQEV